MKRSMMSRLLKIIAWNLAETFTKNWSNPSLEYIHISSGKKAASDKRCISPK